jgi:MFS family permease
MNTAGRISKRFGSKIITTIAAICLCLALPLLALASTLPFLMLALVFFGASNGAMDVTMNLQGADVEKEYGRPIFNSFHACFSIGGLGGALLSSILAGLNISLISHFLAVALCACIGILCSMRLLLPPVLAPEVVDAQEKKASFLIVSRTLLLLGVIALCVVLSEGAMSDWSALYLSGTVHTSAGLAAAGYATFSLFMAVGRGVGDYLVVRFGPALLVRIASSLAAIGLALALAIPWAPTVFVGLGLVGIGISVGFPLALSAASRSTRDRRDAGTALATVSTCGYFGLLMGPPVIGFVADLVGLHRALILVVGLCVIAALCAPVVGIRGVQQEGEVSQASSSSLVP